MESLKEILKNRRADLKLSVRSASKLIGISHTYLKVLEEGRDPRNNSLAKPTPETLKLISNAYKIPYDHLMAAAGYLDEEEKYTDDVSRLKNASKKEQAEFLHDEFVKALIKTGRIRSAEDLTPALAMKLLAEIFEN